MSPVFISENVRDTGYSRIVGNNHLKLSLAQDESTRLRGIDAIAFQAGHYFEVVKRKIPFDVCYTIDENVFNDKTTLQLNVKDIRVK